MTMSFAELSKIRQRQGLEGHVEALEATRQRQRRARLHNKMNRETVRFMAGASIVVTCVFSASWIVELFSIPIAGPGSSSQIALVALAFGGVGALTYKYLREN
jgi:hypothetical protein